MRRPWSAVGHSARGGKNTLLGAKNIIKSNRLLLIKIIHLLFLIKIK